MKIIKNWENFDKKWVKRSKLLKKLVKNDKKLKLCEKPIFSRS